jgi:hypothetical protein
MQVAQMRALVGDQHAALARCSLRLTLSGKSGVARRGGGNLQ